MKKNHRISPKKDFWSKAKFAMDISREAADFVLKYLDEAFSGAEQEEDATLSIDHTWEDDLAHHRKSADRVIQLLEIKQLQLEVIQGVSKHLKRYVEELELERKEHIHAANSLTQRHKIRPIILPPEILADIFGILYEYERHIQVVQLPQSSLTDAAYYGTPTQVVRYNKNTITALLESELFSDEWKRIVLRCAPLILTDGRQNRLFHGQYSNLKGSFQYIHVPELRPYPRYYSLTHLVSHDLSWHVQDVGSIIIMLDGMPARSTSVEKLKNILQLPGKHLHLHIITRGDSRSTKDFNPIPRYILERMNDTLHLVHILDVPPVILPSDPPPRSYPDSYDWAPFENVTITRTNIKIARLPLPFIKGLAPVLTSLRKLTLWIPWHIEKLSTVLSALQCIPQTLNELCIYETRRELRQNSWFEQEEDYTSLVFPNLQDLSFLDFHASIETLRPIADLLDCPLLRTLKFGTWNLRAREYYSLDFIVWMDTRYPSIDRLSLICEVHQAEHTGQEVFEALSNSDYGGIWLFPRLHEVEFSVQREEDLTSLEDLVSARFAAEDVPNLNAIVIWTVLQRGDMESGFVDQDLLNTCVKHLRKLVPYVEVRELHRPFEIDD